MQMCLQEHIGLDRHKHIGTESEIVEMVQA